MYGHSAIAKQDGEDMQAQKTPAANAAGVLITLTT